MNKQITVYEIPEIEIETPLRFEPINPVDFIRLMDAAAIANALARLSTGERREGLIDLAVAIGLRVKR